MMRKRLIIAILGCFILIPALGSEGEKLFTVGHKMLAMDITAVKGQYMDISVNPIYASLSASAGMPFDLTGEDVAYDENSISKKHPAGRQIATWSLHTNFSPVNIKIEAEDLKYKNDSNGSEPIDYILFFPYTYYITDPDGIDNSKTGYMMVRSGEEYNSLDEGNPISDEVFGGINTGEYPVRIMLAETSQDQIEKNRQSNFFGEYTATVTLTVTLEE